MELEAACDPRERGAYPLDGGRPACSTRAQTIRAVDRDVARGVGAGVDRRRASTTRSPTPRPTTARACAADRGLDTVVLSGGAFQNRRLLERTAGRLAQAGLRVLVPGAAAAQRRRHLLRPGRGRGRARGAR